MMMSGQLEFLQAQDLFQYLELNHKTATFQTEKGGVRRTFFFLDGKIVWVSSHKPGEQLGSVIIHENVLLKGQVDQAVRESQRLHMHLTSYLITRKILTSKQVEAAVENLARLIIFRTFQDASGTFQITKDIPRTVLDGTIRLSPQKLIVDFFQEQMRMEEEAPVPDASSALDDILFSPGKVRDLSPSAPPDVAARLFRRLRESDVTTEETCRLAMSSPGICAQMLRAANSPLFRRGDPVENMPQAIASLGFDRIIQMVMTMSLESSRRGMEFRNLRRHVDEVSVKTAFFARDLAFVLEMDVEDLYLLGILHHMGVVVALDLLERRAKKEDIPDMERDRHLIENLVLLNGRVLSHWHDKIHLPAGLLRDLCEAAELSRPCAHGGRVDVVRNAARLVWVLEGSDPHVFLGHVARDPDLISLGLDKRHLDQARDLFRCSIDAVRRMEV